MKTEKTEHTPGPWKIIKNTTNNDIGIKCDLGGVIVKTISGYSESEANANAALIAAAPELLAAAKQINADINKQFHGGRAENYLAHCNALTAAILKAEGR